MRSNYYLLNSCEHDSSDECDLVELGEVHMILGNFSEWTAQNLIIRIIASMILGGIIGLDRGMKHRGAGTKTMTVVCLGATLVMLTEQYIQIHFPGLANMNRLAA